MMPTPTYTLIEEQVLGSAVASVTLGNGGTIPQTYRDLVLEVACTTSTNTDVFLQVNGDASNLYSWTNVYGNGSTASSERLSNTNPAKLDNRAYSTSSSVANYQANIMSYASTSVYKTILVRASNAPTAAEALVNLYRSTSAITSIAVIQYAGTFSVGSTFRLWGV